MGPSCPGMSRCLCGSAPIGRTSAPAVAGLALAAVFVIGLIKTISRGRPKIPEQQLADAMARAQTDDPEKR